MVPRPREIYGTGLTDWSLASTYDKINIFIIASIVRSDGGVIAGLAACGVMMSIVATAVDLMQDFKTGCLTLSSAKSMFVCQLVGTTMECIIVSLTFWMFWSAFEIGTPDSPYKASYAGLESGEGGAICSDSDGDGDGGAVLYRGYFAIDMFVGTVILFVWERVNKKDEEDHAGLICGAVAE
ncbi:unnamed protein product [Lactuca virosa]|uniref:H(+)-exporting diphosphatase n=1 Tax=Lactuca virosa TaxID=75947 RepID=A0AAU9LDQ2_9ASTR|nr:unnamed protein product [Lactuca virosa]